MGAAPSGLIDEMHTAARLPDEAVPRKLAALAAVLLCGAWLGSCVPGFAPPPAVALQQHGSWLERAHDNIRHEYLRLAALNGWAAQPDERERHLATVDAVREFSSRVKSQSYLQRSQSRSDGTAQRVRQQNVQTCTAAQALQDVFLLLLHMNTCQ